MLNVDVRASSGIAPPAPRGSALATRGSGLDRPLVTVGAFALAVLLGVIIGLVTAPGGPDSPGPAVPEPVIAPQLRPSTQPVTWDHQQPGRAHQVLVSREPDPAALRLALRWSLVDYLRARPGGSTLTADDLTIPDNSLFYGAIEGESIQTDTYWAVGPVEHADAASASTPAPAGPHVWKRVGGGPWEVAASGLGACAQLPVPLIEMWRGVPATCARA